jgi:predicted CXXCH cytochrome family protein
MNDTRPLCHRAGPLFGALLLVVAAALAFTPVVPRVGAVDPTPAQLTLAKSVDNTGGGTAAATDWTLSATGPTTISGSSGDSGITNAAVVAGTYALAESGGPTGYDAGPWSCTGGTLIGSSLVLADGETATCSITNTFIPPDPTPTPTPTPEPTPTPTPTPEPMPTPSPTPVVVRGTLGLAADAPAFGRRRVDPGAVVTVHLAAHVLDDAKDVRLVAAIPFGWTVAGAGGGTVDRLDGSVTWVIGDVEADARPEATLRLRTPFWSPYGKPAYDEVLTASLEHVDGILDTASVQLRVAPEIVVEHVTFARVDGVSHEPAYLAPDESLDGVGQFELFRIRFQVRNADLISTMLTPRLQYRIVGAPEFAFVPNEGPVVGLPFYLGTEWRSVNGGRGTLPGPAEEWIPTGELREHDRDDDFQEPIGGRRLMQESDVRAFYLAEDSYSEIEFSVKSSLDLPFSQEFEFRLVDGGLPIQGALTAVARSGPRPPTVLSPGQRSGVYVGPPVDAWRAGVSEMDFPLVVPAVLAAASPGSSATPLYRLAIALPTTPGTQAPFAAPFTSPHMPDVSLVSDTCAICHRAHVAQGGILLTSGSPQSSLCFTCHDSAGAGSSLATEAQYAAVPANNATTRSYYRHDATVPTTHTLAKDNEFGGVSNRHTECGDCHNPHNATTALSTQTTTGWTVAGQNRAVSGVSVANYGVGVPVAYTLLDGTAGNQPTREYQLCFKCHSGFTTLNSNAGQPASAYVLDKAVELNPANASTHPIEQAGTNGTTAMGLSLDGTSPYKQWDFTTASTIRCVNCHGDPAKYDAAAPPAAGSDLAPHASEYRGILIQDYQDRVLQSHDEAYIAGNQAAHFALCYVCHAEEPFTNADSTATNFRYHRLHVSGIAGNGSGSTDIDAAGAGQGNAICAECHFRIHGTALAYNVGDRTNSRLVNFAPNVTASGGVIAFVARNGATEGSCTLTCHGEAHAGLHY